MAKATKDDQPQTDTLVWHYTSYGAADAILRGGLHLSDIRAMNDRSELMAKFADAVASSSPIEGLGSASRVKMPMLAMVPLLRDGAT